jgi:hypothetical protein
MPNVTLHASNLSHYAGDDSGDAGSAMCNASRMTRYACNPIHDEFAALRGAFFGTSDRNDAVRNGLGIVADQLLVKAIP